MSKSNWLPNRLPLQSSVEKHCKTGSEKGALMKRQQVGKGSLSRRETDLEEEAISGHLEE
jgi:hypothetical protein